MQTQDIPYGYCHCGCGEKTRLETRNRPVRGLSKGQPVPYVKGHNGRKQHPAYEVDPQTGCWIWTGDKTPNGYGKGCADGKQFLAHRWYYEQVVGPVPQGLTLDHLCKRRACCNPAHLEPVTALENHRRGDLTRLTEDQVREIRSASRARGSGVILAQKYNVDPSTISAIRRRRLWPDVD